MSIDYQNGKNLEWQSQILHIHSLSNFENLTSGPEHTVQPAWNIFF